MSFTVTSLVGGSNGGSSLFDYKTPGTTQASALSDFIVNPNIPEGGDVYNTIQAAMDAACAAGAGVENPVQVFITAGQYIEDLTVPCNGIFLTTFPEDGFNPLGGLKMNPVEIVGDLTCDVSGPFSADNIVFTGVCTFNNTTVPTFPSTTPEELNNYSVYQLSNCTFRLSPNIYDPPTFPDYPTSPQCLQVLGSSRVQLERCRVQATGLGNGVLVDTPLSPLGALSAEDSVLVFTTVNSGGFFMNGGSMVGPLVLNSSGSTTLRRIRLSSSDGLGPAIQIAPGVTGQTVSLYNCTIAVGTPDDPENWASGDAGNTIFYTDCSFERFSVQGVTGGIALSAQNDLNSNPVKGEIVVNPAQAGERVFSTIQEAIDYGESKLAGSTGCQNVFIAPGTYNENLRLVRNVNLYGVGDASANCVNIVGSHTGSFDTALPDVTDYVDLALINLNFSESTLALISPGQRGRTQVENCNFINSTTGARMLDLDNHFVNVENSVFGDRAFRQDLTTTSGTVFVRNNSLLGSRRSKYFADVNVSGGTSVFAGVDVDIRGFTANGNGGRNNIRLGTLNGPIDITNTSLALTHGNFVPGAGLTGAGQNLVNLNNSVLELQNDVGLGASSDIRFVGGSTANIDSCNFATTTIGLVTGSSKVNIHNTRINNMLFNPALAVGVAPDARIDITNSNIGTSRIDLGSVPVNFEVKNSQIVKSDTADGPGVGLLQFNGVMNRRILLENSKISTFTDTVGGSNQNLIYYSGTVPQQVELINSVLELDGGGGAGGNNFIVSSVVGGNLTITTQGNVATTQTTPLISRLGLGNVTGGAGAGTITFDNNYTGGSATGVTVAML